MISFEDFPQAQNVFRFFEEISAIPRGSGHTDAIADYLVKFAEKRGLSCVRDETNNVLIRKGATDGMETKMPIILQAHTDMVMDTTPDCPVDPKKDGVQLVREGDILRAAGSTLGGDDGTGVALMLAILDADDIPHPPLEALFTSDEEIGLIGASAFDTSLLQGTTLINLDSEDEGVFTAGCAGGVRCDAKIPVTREKSHTAALRLSVGGLLGGHSGMLIHEGHANAILTLCELLRRVKETDGSVRIAHFEGGTADNAIPREAFALITTSLPGAELMGRVINPFLAEKRKQFEKVEPELSVLAEPAGKVDTVLDAASTDRLLAFLAETPSGVQAYSRDVAGLVQTSLNPGIAKTGTDTFSLSTLVRSSVTAEKEALRNKLEAVTLAANGTFSTRGDYPAWEFRKESHLRDVCTKTYRALTGKKAVTNIIHAGLECGLFASKIPMLDCVSLGADSKDVHTTAETLSISSVARVFEFLKRVLKEM